MKKSFLLFALILCFSVGYAQADKLTVRNTTGFTLVVSAFAADNGCSPQVSSSSGPITIAPGAIATFFLPAVPATNWSMIRVSPAPGMVGVGGRFVSGCVTGCGSSSASPLIVTWLSCTEVGLSI